MIRELTADTAQIGLFTAKAKLEANFDNARDPSDDGTLPDGAHIGGEITNFVSDAGMALEGWKVQLNGIDLVNGDFSADIPNGDVVTPGDRVFGDGTDSLVPGGVAATVGGHTFNGNWRGTFHGNDRGDNQPGSVAGTFEAISDAVGIAGAFGAQNVSPDN